MRMQQVHLWDSPQQVDPSIDGLRPEYQEPCVEDSLAHIASGKKRGLIKIFTGGGKSTVGIALIRRWLASNGTDHALWLAPRTFLIEDAIARAGSALGTWISREQASFRGTYTRMTVGSMQTYRGDRLLRMDPERFGLIVCDESQIFDSPSALKIFDHFTRASFIGLSATPGDAVAFGGRQSVIFNRDILWGQQYGFLVPFEPRYEDVVGLDLSEVDSADGDLKIGSLDRAVVKVATGIAKLSWDACGDRPTLIYCPGVATVHAVTAWLNEQRPGCAVATTASTPPKVRRQTLQDFKDGKIQYIVNCGIYLFGLDVPTCRAVVIARPTEDRDLWEQMVGRLLRPADGIGQLPSAEERFAAMAMSSKPDGLLLILSGEAGKHSLCDVGDLDETSDPKVRKKASEDIRQNPAKPLSDALRDARAWQRKENERIILAMEKARLESKGGTFDPFAAPKWDRRNADSPYAPKWVKEPATDAQRWWQRSMGLPTDITKFQAGQFRAQHERWVKAGIRSWRDLPFHIKQEEIMKVLSHGAIREPGEDDL